MPSPYSCDLRKRVVEHYEAQGSLTLTSKLFSISRSTIYDWLKLKEASGSLKAKAGYQKGHSHKVKDLEKFKQCIEKNAGLTLEGIIQKSNIKMSLMTCSRSIKKLNITRKKRLTDIKSEMKTSDRAL